MFNAVQACQDCHGNMTQVGNDFSTNVSAANPGGFVIAGDFYSNPATPRVPWANEPMCQSRFKSRYIILRVATIADRTVSWQELHRTHS